jgi:HSP20 family protein
MMLRRLDANGGPVLRIRNDVDRLFNELVDTVSRGRMYVPFGRGAFPALNAWEDDQKLFVEAELPGYSLDDLEVYVSGGDLTLKGERKTEAPENVTYHRRERGTGQFSRVLRLPVEVDADKVEAHLRNGVLSLTLPKAQSVLPRKIEVKS